MFRVMPYSSSSQDKYKIVAASNDASTHTDLWEVETQSHAFLNSDLNGKLHAPIVLSGNTASSTLAIAMALQVGLHVDEDAYCPCQESNLVVHYVAQSLHWPSYTGPSVQILS